MVLVKLDSHMQKTTSRHYSTPYLKFNSKWIKGLNMRPEIIKFLKENRFHDIALGNNFFFFWIWPKAKAIKAKINKYDYTKLKSFCTAKETINTMRTEQEKIVVNLISDEGLVFKIHKNSYKSVEEKTHDIWFKNG